MQDEPLFSITLITDDETGMYTVGDVDWEIPGTVGEWLAEDPSHGAKLADTLEFLAKAARAGESPLNPTDEEYMDKVHSDLSKAVLSYPNFNRWLNRRAWSRIFPGDANAMFRDPKNIGLMEQLGETIGHVFGSLQNSHPDVDPKQIKEGLKFIVDKVFRRL